MEERAFFRESETTKPAMLNCPFCRTADTYELRWMLRKKLDQAPRGADERDAATTGLSVDRHRPRARLRLGLRVRAVNGQRRRV